MLWPLGGPRSLTLGFISALLLLRSSRPGLGLDVAPPDDPDAAAAAVAAAPSEEEAAQPSSTANDHLFLVPLRRELYPVRRKGKVVSFKASYSGLIHVGSPWPQEFRVVFDTGSGHIILPALKCTSDSCLKHRRYDMAVSETAEAIMLDGSRVRPHQSTDQVTIGFGTGKITGEFVREKVCVGPAQPPKGAEDSHRYGPCIDAQVVMAIEMSNRPFEVFDFDGILGLGLDSLAISKNFSFFNVLTGSQQLAHAHFGVFLTDGDDGQESEIALGGHNAERLLEPLSWVPMHNPELGYWQVQIFAVYIDDVKLDMCDEGTCNGILDTGTSHLGIPSHHGTEMDELLTRPAGDLADCRRSKAPTIQIQLKNVNLTLHPENYMRKLPLPEDVMVDTQVGVSPTSYLENSNQKESDLEGTAPNESETENGTVEVRTLCTPKLLPVTWPAPVGPNLFILGEPVLHRYYTVFDWGNYRAGFGLARHRRHLTNPATDDGSGSASHERENMEAPVQDEILLVQMIVTVTVRSAPGPSVSLDL